ncbi:hypothetical protein LUZ60_017639 [Juncus effusus]|nr:hypothetical protein LUZ60_017639 [Juncus effusus]
MHAKGILLTLELLITCAYYIRTSRTCPFTSNMGFGLDKCDLSIKECSNINFVWASLIVEELVRLGVTYYCIAPGSRSSPLAICATRHPSTNCISCYDERSLAFNALGYARGSRTPAVVITSSGTAVSNLYPAVVEASQGFIPIIILTADRPPELLDCGANQAIDQVNHFGKYVRHFSNLPPPTDQIPSKTVLTTIDSLLYHCNETTGPVHINCQFRDPLHDSPLTWSTDCLTGLDRWLTNKEPYTKYIKPQNFSIGTNCIAMMEVMEIINGASKGILVIGEVCSETDIWGLVTLVRELSWPVVVDVLSGLRIRRVFSSFLENVCFVDHMDHALLSENFASWCKPDVVLQIGGRITSKRVSQFLESCAPNPYILADRHPYRHDPSHVITHRIQCTITEFVSTLCKFYVPKKKATRWTGLLRELNSVIAREIEFQINSETAITEPYIAHKIGEALGADTDTALFIGNSMVIRDMDMYGKGSVNCMKNGVDFAIYEQLGFCGIQVAGNRGASGIDGLLSSAIGFSVGSNKKVLCMVGDVSFLHDTNGLSLLNQKSRRKPITIIVVNNHGGAIFSLLPIANKTEHDILNKFFYTAHDISLSHLCSAHSVKHVLVRSKPELQNALKHCQHEEIDSVIEVASSISSNAEFHCILRQSACQVVNQAMEIIRRGAQSDNEESIMPISRILKAEYASFRIKLSASPTSSEMKDEKYLYREGLILKVTLDDESIGFGEVMPIEIHEESLSDAESQIRFLIQKIKGCKIENFLPLLNGSFSQWIWRNIGIPPSSIFPSVRCGMEMAILNAISAHQKTNLSDLLLGTRRPSNDTNTLEITRDYSTKNIECIEICALVDCDGSPIEVAHFVSNLVEEGFTAVKLKVARGRTPIEDARVIQKIREIVGYKIDIRVDANRRWTFAEAIQFGSIVKEYNLQYIEEPIQPKYDIIKFCEESGLPVALDETIDAIKEDFINHLQEYVHLGIVAIVIKPSRVGGFDNAALIANWAHINGKMAVISSAYESSLSLATYAQFSYFLQIQNQNICKIRNMYFNGGIAHGLGTYKWIKEDILDQGLKICLQPNEEKVRVSMKVVRDFIENFCWGNERILRKVCNSEEIRSCFVKVDDGHSLSCLVRVQEAGSCTNKNKVVFLHGFLGTSEEWILMMKSLSPNIKTISIDLPGHGKSQIKCNSDDTTNQQVLISVELISNLLLNVINKISTDGERVVLVGYSMGARIALQMISNSDKIKGAVIISGSPGLRKESNKRIRHKVDKSRAQMLLSLGLNPFLKSWYSSKLWASLREHPHFDRILQSRTHHDSTEDLAKVLCDSSIGNQRSLWEDLGTWKKPLLIIAGEKDPKFKNISYEMYTEIMKSSNDKTEMEKFSEVVIIQHSGHAIHLENPLSLMHAIRNFLSKLD